VGTRERVTRTRVQVFWDRGFAGGTGEVDTVDIEHVFV